MAETFDAILLDYDLDDGKGTTLIPSILALSPRPLLVAASSHAEGNARLLKAGANIICSKLEFAHIEAVLLAGSSSKTEQCSLLDVTGVDLAITTEEIVHIIRESRERL